MLSLSKYDKILEIDALRRAQGDNFILFSGGKGFVVLLDTHNLCNLRIKPVYSVFETNAIRLYRYPCRDVLHASRFELICVLTYVS